MLFARRKRPANLEAARIMGTRNDDASGHPWPGHRPPEAGGPLAGNSAPP